MNDAPLDDAPLDDAPLDDADNKPAEKAKPLVVELTPGKHALCGCGQTGNAPFCDGSHAGTAFRPEIVTVEKVSMNVAWCTCRRSDNIPRCDGSHRQLWDDPSKPPKKPE